MLHNIYFFLLCIVLTVSGCSSPAEQSVKHLQIGKALLENKLPAAAFKEFDIAIQLNKKNAEAYYYLGLIDENNKNWQSMFSNMTQAILLDANLLNAHLKLANLEILANKQEEASIEIDTILSKEPENKEGLILKGMLFLKKKKYNDAMEIADKVLVIDPDYFRALALKTNVYTETKDYLKAVEFIDNSLKSKKYEVNLYLLRLQIHSLLDDKNGLEEDYINLIKRLPDNIEYRYALIKIYTESKRFADAEALYNAIISKYPNDLNAKKLYLDYIKSRDIQSAYSKINEFIANQPEVADFYIMLSDLYINNGKEKEAEDVLNSLIERNKPPEKGITNYFSTINKDSRQVLEARNMLAKMAYKANDLQKADDIIGQITISDFNNYDALVLKAKIRIDKNEIEEALSILRGLSNNYVDKDEHLALLGRVYQIKNNYILADEAFRKALEINPGNFDAVIPVVNKMLERKDLQRAEDLITKALKVNPGQSEGLKLLDKINSLKLEK